MVNTSRVRLNKTTIKDELVIIDFLSIFYRGTFVHGGLSHEGTPTGGLFGVLQQLFTAMMQTSPNNIIFCSDIKPYLRALEYPEYKSNRGSTKTPEEIKQLVLEQTMCREFIRNLCIPFIEKKGYEADDLIALLVKKFHKDYKNITIVSGDSDLYQLFVYENVGLYQGAKKGFYYPKDFKEEFPDLKSPEQWNEVLAYSGGHNGFEGIKGIGIKTGIKIVNKAPLSVKIRKDIAANKKRVALNIKLGELPFYKIKNRNISVPIVGKYNERKLVRFLAKYGIKLQKHMADCFLGYHDGGY